MPTGLAATIVDGGPPSGDVAAVIDAVEDTSHALRARPRASDGLEAALVAARELLASTVEAVHPGTSARRLFTYVTQYRARLADLVAACSVPGGGAGA
jgi:hypothetical protein